MDFRWKVPELKPNFVDPQGVRSTMAAQQMQGYAPNPQPNMGGYQPNVQPNVRGMAPSQAAQQNNAALAEQNYQQFVKDDAALQEKKQKLATLEQQLMKIDSDLAQLQQGGADEEKAIAAKLAEIGDTSLYQGILAREQNQAAQQKSNASSIDNMLFEADKLSWGLNANKSDEAFDIAKQNIRAFLDRAKLVSEQTGTPLPPKYAELERKLKEADEASASRESDIKRANELYLLKLEGRLEDSHIKEMEDYIRENPNSEISTKYRQLIEEFKGQTKESKAAASKRSSDAKAIVDTLRDLPLDEQLRRWSKMSPSKQKLVKDHGYIMDPKLGITSKDGI